MALLNAEMTLAATPSRPQFGTTKLESVQAFLVSMIFISSLYVKIEPAACDLFLVVAVLRCVSRGLSLTPAIMALFLAFSRGAWVKAIMAAGIMIFFTFLLSPSSGLRRRMVFSAIAGSLVFAIVLGILLSVPATHDLFLDRFTLVKSYGGGETGRFGNPLNSIPILQVLSFGLGPYQFAGVFDLAAHNTFLNSFSSPGWIAGVAYIMLIVSDFIVGFRTMFLRTAFQPFSIAVFACLVSVVLQCVQIDIEHSRHLYWMTGIMWGFFAASFAYRNKPMKFSDIATAWNLAQQRGARR